MISIRQSRSAAAVRERRVAARAAPPWAERALHGLGAHPAFADALLGDLAEERARRKERQGATAARWWYAREALRSVPHLLRDAARHGGVRGHARAAAAVAAMALVPTVAVVALLLRDGPPARLVVDGQGGGVSHGVVLNARQVRLTMRALDANGRPLRSAKVQYRWVAGAPMRITPNGVVTCARPGDATVRASAGAAATNVLLRCRPVKRVLAERSVQLVLGGPGKDLTFMAAGPDGRPVDLLAGEIHVEDSTVATLNGTHIHPVASGYTNVILRIGDSESYTGVTVYEQVRDFTALRPDQRFVVAPVRLTRGDTIRVSLPKGLFTLLYGSASHAQPTPHFSVDGPVMCMPDFGPKVNSVFCLVRGPGAALRVMYPRTATAPEIVGSVALERREYP